MYEWLLLNLYPSQNWWIMHWSVSIGRDLIETVGTWVTALPSQQYIDRCWRYPTSAAQNNSWRKYRSLWDNILLSEVIFYYKLGSRVLQYFKFNLDPHNLFIWYEHMWPEWYRENLTLANQPTCDGGDHKDNLISTENKFWWGVRVYRWQNLKPRLGLTKP